MARPSDLHRADHTTAIASAGAAGVSSAGSGGDADAVAAVGHRRTGVALFLATAGLIAAPAVPAAAMPSPGASPLMQAALNSAAAATGHQEAAALAQVSDCIPIGEGENCERQTLEQRRRQASPQPAATPAAAPSTSGSNPGAAAGGGAEGRP